MKTIISKITLLSALLFIAVSCTEDMNYKDANVTPVNQLYEPTDAKMVTLKASATASLFFEWESAKVEDSGSPLYEVVFDKVGGDFSKPIYKVLSDNSGSRNYATISHKDLNKIASYAGLGGGETGTLTWTVIASRGLNSAIAKQSKTLTITRLLGFSEVPNQLFLTGSATEGGEDPSKAVVCASPESECFEIFTKLEAGKSYKLIDRATSDAETFYIVGNKILEGDNGTMVDKTGVYRIFMDFSIASVTIKEISSMGLWFCPNNSVIMDLPYISNGIFSGQNVIEFKQEGWGRDQRYKLLMTYADGTVQYWGTKNTTDSNPGAATPEDPYFYITETPNNQWDQKWKFNNVFDGASDGYNPGAVTKVSAIFNVTNYTHKVELVN